MTALELLQALGQVTWIVVAAATGLGAVRRPTRSNVDVALFFGAIALAVIEGRVASAIGLPTGGLVTTASLILVMAIPYLLLRLVNDFAGVRRLVLRMAEAGFVVAVAVIVTVGVSGPAEILYLVLYFAAVAIYAAARVSARARSSVGITRRRMMAVAWGSYFLGLALLIAGVGVFAPPLAGVVSALTQVATLAASLSYALGFATPATLKRYWQTPELRELLARASTLPRLTLVQIADELAQVAARTFGARATIGLWDEHEGVLRFRDPHGALPDEMGPSEFLGWRVFESQRAIYVPDAAAAHSSHADAYRQARVGPVLVAPISAGQRRIGVLEVFAEHEPVFAEDDLATVQLLAQQAAILLESRSLIDDAARVRAQEEAARLKEDFVSAAAHDLKTPLTTIMAQAQLLELRAEREGRAGELTGIRRLVRETRQLAHLVDELLDASRLERGAFPIEREQADVGLLARDVAGRERAGSERIEVVVDGAVSGRVDPDRIRQLLANLLENALKYSPAESPVTVRVWGEGDEGRIAVADRGIGIPAEDRPFVFDRFRRGSNVDHRRFAGIGLGLYICRGIAVQHGGRIWVESEPGRDTTFQVAIPLAPLEDGVGAERPAGAGVAAT